MDPTTHDATTHEGSPHVDISRLSDDELSDEIATWSGRVAAGEARLLALVAELDRREAWAGPGMLSCAHWLSWRTGLGLVAARERVRAARRLVELPAVAAALAAGRLSWTAVRAVTRVATPGDGVDWVNLARSASGAQIERIARGLRRVQETLADEADPDRAGHRLRTTVRHQPDGSLSVTVRARAEDGALLLAALEAVRTDLDRRAAQGDAARASDSDALVEMARRTLDAPAPRRARQRARTRLTAQVDPLTGWARLRDGELLPPASLRRALAGSDPTRHDRGRRSRLAGPALRALLGTLDGERCRFPGCTGPARSTPTTCATGRTAAARTSRTWSSSAPATTRSSTSAASGSPCAPATGA